MLNSPCPLQDEEVLEELPEEAEEDASTAMTTTTKEEVGAQSSAVQVGQEQIPADRSDHCWAAASQMAGRDHLQQNTETKQKKVS